MHWKVCVKKTSQFKSSSFFTSFFLLISLPFLFTATTSIAFCSYATPGSIASAGAAVQWMTRNFKGLDNPSDIGPLAATVPDTSDIVYVLLLLLVRSLCSY
jgi:hypothetical protein